MDDGAEMRAQLRRQVAALQLQDDDDPPSASSSSSQPVVAVLPRSAPPPVQLQQPFGLEQPSEPDAMDVSDAGQLEEGIAGALLAPSEQQESHAPLQLADTAVLQKLIRPIFPNPRGPAVSYSHFNIFFAIAHYVTTTLGANIRDHDDLKSDDKKLDQLFAEAPRTRTPPDVPTLTFMYVRSSYDNLDAHKRPVQIEWIRKYAATEFGDIDERRLHVDEFDAHSTGRQDNPALAWLLWTVWVCRMVAGLLSVPLNIVVLFREVSRLPRRPWHYRVLPWGEDTRARQARQNSAAAAAAEEQQHQQQPYVYKPLRGWQWIPSDWALLWLLRCEARLVFFETEFSRVDTNRASYHHASAVMLRSRAASLCSC